MKGRQILAISLCVIVSIAPMTVAVAAATLETDDKTPVLELEQPAADHVIKSQSEFEYRVQNGFEDTNSDGTIVVQITAQMDFSESPRQTFSYERSKPIVFIGEDGASITNLLLRSQSNTSITLQNLEIHHTVHTEQLIHSAGPVSIIDSKISVSEVRAWIVEAPDVDVVNSTGNGLTIRAPNVQIKNSRLTTTGHLVRNAADVSVRGSIVNGSTITSKQSFTATSSQLYDTQLFVQHYQPNHKPSGSQPDTRISNTIFHNGNINIANSVLNNTRVTQSELVGSGNLTVLDSMFNDSIVETDDTRTVKISETKFSGTYDPTVTGPIPNLRIQNNRLMAPEITIHDSCFSNTPKPVELPTGPVYAVIQTTCFYNSGGISYAGSPEDASVRLRNATVYNTTSERFLQTNYTVKGSNFVEVPTPIFGDDLPEQGSNFVDTKNDSEAWGEWTPDVFWSSDSLQEPLLTPDGLETGSTGITEGENNHQVDDTDVNKSKGQLEDQPPREAEGPANSSSLPFSPSSGTQTGTEGETETETERGITIQETNTPVSAGNSVEVTAAVTNPGPNPVTKDIRLIVGHDPQQVDMKTVTVEPGVTKRVTVGYETPPVKNTQEFPVRIRAENSTATKSVRVYGTTSQKYSTDKQAQGGTGINVSIAETNTPINAGKRLTVTGELTNTRNDETTQNVRLIVGHTPEQVGSQTVTFQPNETKTVTLGYQTPRVKNTQEFPVKIQTNAGSAAKSVRVYGTTSNNQ
ncbi:hypothetical protein [Natrinema amylolyticum]|uniref:COG1470 family protein n=1 Tax=Natrinema amylolyticum TaxID=2878679 RepID=UPI001CF9D1B5|nr:hypothetical protein [Natrinema amylolyticum]